MASLVTTAEARTYLGASATDDPSDPLLEQVIEGLSARVVAYTGDDYAEGAPANVKLAILIWVAALNKRDNAFVDAETARTVLGGVGMPYDVRELLAAEGNQPYTVAV
jgi:hypothetical protein